MAKGKRTPRPRTTRRELQRASDKVGEDREKLFVLEPGGRADRPIEVETATLVEPRAEAMSCPRCGVAFRVTEHTAQTVDGVRLREAVVYCSRCGRHRSLWFRIVGPATLN